MLGETCFLIDCICYMPWYKGCIQDSHTKEMWLKFFIMINMLWLSNIQYCIIGNQSKRPHSKTATTRTATLSGITTRTATLLWSKRPHCFGQSGHISWVATKTATLFWSKRPHSFWSKRPQSASPVKGADLASKTASLHLVKTVTLSSIILC